MDPARCDNESAESLHGNDASHPPNERVNVFGNLSPGVVIEIRAKRSNRHGITEVAQTPAGAANVKIAV